MPANALVQTRVDRTVKAQAAEILADMGLTVSDAVRLMLIRVARDKVLPFEPFVPGPITIAAMEEARRGEGLKSFDSVEALMADLNAEDEDD